MHTANRVIALIAFFSISAVVAAEVPERDRCLSPEQLAEMNNRIFQAMPLGGSEAFALHHLKQKQLMATAEDARQALLACEAGPTPSECGPRRASLEAANGQLAALNSEFASVRKEAGLRGLARAKAVRAEYPSCGVVDR
jgi:hypothetical protein